MQFALDLAQISQFLKGLSLFNSLEELELSVVAERFAVVQGAPDQVFVNQGQLSNGFYLIYDGQAASRRDLSPEESLVDVLVRGDFFGEDSLFENRSEPATVTALTPVVLLFLSPDHFLTLIDAFPAIKGRLIQFVKSHDYLETHQFDWLNEEEVIYQVHRRHIAALILSLILPAFVIFIGLVIAAAALLMRGNAAISMGALILAAVVLGIGCGWFIWRWIDWGNDVYFVTNQRVVWLERVIGLYENRQEVPLSAILSVNVKTAYFGRIFSYGDVRVTTYTGGLSLEMVGNPYQLAGLISEYTQRSQDNRQQADLETLRHSIHQIVNGESENEPQPPPQGAKSLDLPRKSDEVREPSWTDKYIKRILQTRIEEGNTITYRKHWLVFFKRAFLSLTVFFLIFFLFVSFVIISLQSAVKTSIFLAGSFVALIALAVVFGWVSYHYVDWLNDIYQITDRSIFDIEKKPLGTETRRSAPLENILSLENVRPGFLGYVLNVGTVIVNVGDAKLTFLSVYDPTRVQQDIFNRMNALKVKKQREEVARERERILKLIEIYHEEVGKETKIDPGK